MFRSYEGKKTFAEFLNFVIFFFIFSYVTVEQFELAPGQSIFKKNIGSGKGLFYTTIWFEPEVSSSICLEVMKEQRLF